MNTRKASDTSKFLMPRSRRLTFRINGRAIARSKPATSAGVFYSVGIRHLQFHTIMPENSKHEKIAAHSEANRKAHACIEI